MSLIETKKMSSPAPVDEEELPLRSGQVYRPETGEDACRHVGHFFRHHRLRFEGQPNLQHFFHGHAQIGDLSFHSLSYGACATVDVPPIEGFYLLQWTLAGSSRYKSRFADFVAGPDTLVIVGPGMPYQKSWASDCLQLIVRVDRRCLESHLAGSSRFPERPLIFDFAAFGRTAETNSLLWLIERVVEDWDSGGTGLAAKTAQASTQRLLLDLLVQQSQDQERRNLSSVAEMAVALIHHNLRNPIGLSDIAGGAGVSVRTLQKVFADELKMSPLAYLRCARLDSAHRALSSPDSCNKRVTDVALDSGFDHLSKFALHYRRRFGELPSHTLRRARAMAGESVI